MAAAKPTLDITKLMDKPLALLEGLRQVYTGPDLKLVELAIANHTGKPKKAAPQPEADDEEAEFIPEAPKAKAKPKAAPAKPVATAYYQRVEVYRGRCRIKGGICRDQLDNVIAQLQALKANPAVLTYAECQVQFPWDKSQG